MNSTIEDGLDSLMVNICGYTTQNMRDYPDLAVSLEERQKVFAEALHRQRQLFGAVEPRQETIAVRGREPRKWSILHPVCVPTEVIGGAIGPSEIKWPRRLA